MPDDVKDTELPFRSALTMHEPWATLLATGVKRIETRSWPAPPGVIGSMVALHGAVAKPAPGRIGDFEVRVPLGDGPDWPWTLRHLEDPGVKVRLALGAVAGTARLAACVPMIGRDEIESSAMFVRVGLEPGDTEAGWEAAICVGGGEYRDATRELDYGHFEPGRWAWVFTDAATVGTRCPWCLRTDAAVNDTDPPGVCGICHGDGPCVSVPARGGQRVWRWRGPADGTVPA